MQFRIDKMGWGKNDLVMQNNLTEFALVKMNKKNCTNFQNPPRSATIHLKPRKNQICNKNVLGWSTLYILIYFDKCLIGTTTDSTTSIEIESTTPVHPNSQGLFSHLSQTFYTLKILIGLTFFHGLKLRLRKLKV